MGGTQNSQNIQNTPKADPIADGAETGRDAIRAHDNKPENMTAIGADRAAANTTTSHTGTQPKQCVEDLADCTRDDIHFQRRVVGLNYDGDVTIQDILAGCSSTGYQATNLSYAIDEVIRMRQSRAKVYFGCTSNMVSSGLREAICYMARHRHFEVFVCTGGGIEEDLIKCLDDTYVADFNLDGKELRENGWNRIGNLAIHNDNYCKFERWFNSAMDELLSGHTAEYPHPSEYTVDDPLTTTPSQFIRYLGRRIDDERSILYWCYKQGISVYSPAITDGSIGDMLTFYRRRGAFRLDIVEDIYNINTECLTGRENGAIILGCGLIKHHILNANLFNNGLEYCVLINTASEYDGSDAGASLNEACSWGKVKPGRGCVKVHGDASIIFPLLICGAYKSSHGSRL